MKIEEILHANSNLTLSKKIVLNLMYTRNVIADQMSDHLKCYDLSIEQFNVLRILRGMKGNPATMTLIQDRMVAKTSNITRLVDKLLAKNLVNRCVCEENRRKVEITITAKGLDLLLEIDPIIENLENKFVSHMSNGEVELLNSLLEKFRNF
jgi:DNA-binding MarR family transcriptional regulator